MGGESEPHRASFNSPAITGLADVLGDGAYTRTLHNMGFYIDVLMVDFIVTDCFYST